MDKIFVYWEFIYSWYSWRNEFNHSTILLTAVCKRNNTISSKHIPGMYQFASFNNKPFRFLYRTTATKKEQQNGWVWHNLFDRKVFLKIKRENRIKCIVCNWSIFLKAAYNFVIFFCICVLSSVCNLMHLWQRLYFLDKFFFILQHTLGLSHTILLKWNRAERIWRKSGARRMQVPINCFRIRFMFTNFRLSVE